MYPPKYQLTGRRFCRCASRRAPASWGAVMHYSEVGLFAAWEEKCMRLHCSMSHGRHGRKMRKGKSTFQKVQISNFPFVSPPSLPLAIFFEFVFYRSVALKKRMSVPPRLHHELASVKSAMDENVQKITDEALMQGLTTPQRDLLSYYRFRVGKSTRLPRSYCTNLAAASIHPCLHSTLQCVSIVSALALM